MIRYNYNINYNHMFTLKTKGLQETVTLKNLPTLRQTFVAASLLIVAAFVLAKAVDPRWMYLALLPAFGLMLAGLSGFCPMVAILQKMPWNKLD